MKKFLNNAITMIRGENYILDENIGFFSILSFILLRFIMLLRGIVRCPLLSMKHRIFLGRHITLLGFRNITFMGSFTLFEYTQVNSISKNVNYIGKNFSLGSHSKIISTSVLSQLGHGFEFGDNVGINAFCFLGAQGGLKIGSDTIIGPYTAIFTENHDYKGCDAKTRLNPCVRKDVKIGRNCWLGARVTVLPGSRLGDNCVVAAGAVVRGVVPDNCIYLNFDRIIKK